jgi:hypothetical protein
VTAAVTVYPVSGRIVERRIADRPHLSARADISPRPNRSRASQRQAWPSLRRQATGRLAPEPARSRHQATRSSCRCCSGGLWREVHGLQ